MSRCEPGQLNVGVIMDPMDSPVVADFAASLDRINARAGRSSGFVWRLQIGAGDATVFRPHDNANMPVNMSVWKDLESVRCYAHNSEQAQIMRRRSKGPGPEAFTFCTAPPPPDALPGMSHLNLSDVCPAT